MNVRFVSHRAQVEKAVESAIDKALDEMGNKAVQLAQNYAPVDTGNMRASLTHERFDQETEIVGTSESQAPIKPVEYAPYVELGTSRMRPQPFLRPAIENNAEQYKQIIEECFREIK